MGNLSLWILMLCVSLLCLGHGLSASLVSVEANAAEFGTDVTGFVMAGYSAGLLISTFVTPRLVKSVGHVRTFSGLASIVSTAVLLFPLWVDPIFWFVLRLISGLCVSGMYIVCESWLNTASSNKNRGQMLSVYMIVTYGALGAVIGFMMWIWFSVMVVLLGAELNAEIEHQTARDSTTGPELPLGARGAVMADNVGRAFHIGKFKDQAIDDGRRQVQRVRGILRR